MDDKTNYLRLSTLFPEYKLNRARAWLKAYSPDSYQIFKAIGDNREDEWVSEEGAELLTADINRANPNIIDLEVVYARILKMSGRDSAEAFKAELLRMREKKRT